MSTLTIRSPARVAVSRPPCVSITAWSRPEASISSQPTQRLALPQAPTSSPSAFQKRTAASALSEASMETSWSQPIPACRLAIARTSSGVGAKGADRASTTTKSLPSPFIFRNGRLMMAGYIGENCPPITFRKTGPARAIYP